MYTLKHNEMFMFVHNFLIFLHRDQVRRERAMKYARVARLFPQPQEKRTLTRDTMDQIRFLKEDQPEEWTISRLADSFKVSERVILKVLKSKFVPSEKTRVQQDVTAKVNLGLLPAGSTDENDLSVNDIDVSDSTKALVEKTSQKLLSDKASSKLQTARHFKFAKQTKQLTMFSEESQIKSKYGSSKRKENNNVNKGKQMPKVNVSAENTQHQRENNNVKQVYKVEMAAENVQNHLKERESKQGRKFKKVKAKKIVTEVNENELDNFEGSDTPPDWGEDDECEPMKVVQKGREFYDENGELLFRV